MQLLWLQYFVTVAKYQSISRAAREHTIPPPAMSSTIKRLESELGVELFDHKGNRLCLNENGRQFSFYATRALAAIDDGITAVSEQPSSPSGHVRILLMDNRNLVMLHVADICKRYPDIHVSVSHDVVNPYDFDCDMCVSVQSVHPNLRASFPLVDESLMIAVRADHPLAGRSSVDLRELSGERFIMLPPSSSLHQLAMEACRLHHLSPNIVIVSDDWHNIMEFVAQGLGIAFVPSNPWNGFYTDQYKILPINGPRMPRITYVRWNPDKYISSALRVFLSDLRSVSPSGVQ